MKMHQDNQIQIETQATNNERKVEAYPEERRETLLKWNIGAGILHAIQALMQLILAFTVDNFKNFKLPIRNYYWSSIGTGNDGEYLQTISSLRSNIQNGTINIYIFLFIRIFPFSSLYTKI